MQGNGPQWFSVETKTGLTYEYGNSVDSRFMDESGSTVVFWKLNRVRDNYGNYIEYKYTNTDRDSRIDEINYTGNINAGLAPYAKIKFYYTSRIDQNVIYIGGQSLKQRYLLSRIQITTESSTVPVKDYYFSYGTDNITSFLTEVKEVGSNGTSLNPTIFKYGTTTTEFSRHATSSITGTSDQDIFSGDFNGDGISDIVVADYIYDNQVQKKHTNFKIYRKLPPPSNAFTLAYQQAFGSPAQISYYPNQLQEKSFYTNDINGDGRDDVMLAFKSWTNNKILLSELRAYLTNDDFALSAQTYQLFIPSPIATREIIPNSNYILTGDFDGDGRSEAITMLKNTANTTVSALFHSFVDGSTTFFSTPNIGSTWAQGGDVFVVDFNGDGKDDVLQRSTITGNTCNVWSINKSGSSYTATIIATHINSQWQQIFPGDFNGDRKIDILAKTQSGVWQIGISKGTSFEIRNFSFTNNPLLNNALHHLRIADFNGDGMQDIAYIREIGTESKFDVYYSKGDNFYYRQYTDTGSSNIGAVVAIGDYNADGKAELLNRPNLTLDIYRFFPNSTHLLLHKTANGFNNTTVFNYNTLAAGGSSLYARGATTAYPVNNVALPLWVVSQVSNSDGIGGMASTNYKYEQAKIHRAGIGWLGFSKIIAENPVQDRRTTHTFELSTNQSAYYKMSLKQELVTLSSNTTAIVSIKDFNYEFILLSRLRVFEIS